MQHVNLIKKNIFESLKKYLTKFSKLRISDQIFFTPKTLSLSSDEVIGYINSKNVFVILE